MKRISTKGNIEQEVLGVGSEQQDRLGLLCPYFQPPAVPILTSVLHKSIPACCREVSPTFCK